MAASSRHCAPSRHSRAGGNPESLITENLDVWASAVRTKATQGRGSSKKIDLYGINKLRNLILELAFSGNLVESTNIDSSDLFEQLTNIKNDLIKKKVLKKIRNLGEIEPDETRLSIPNNWSWVRLSDVFDVRDGTHDSPKYQETGYPLVTSKNIYARKLDLTNVKYISEEDHLKISERSKVDKGDILFAMIGSIGNPVIIDIDPEFSVKNVGLFKYYDFRLSNQKYLLYYLQLAEVWFKEEASGAVQSFVSLGKLRSYPFPLAPLEEQGDIVKKIEALMALCDQLEQQQENSISAHQTLVETLLNTLVTAAGTTAQSADKAENNFDAAWDRIAEHFDTLFTTERSIDQLKQTLLQLAVMGKLVPQNPNDEPASVLLEKIAAEKAQLIKDKKIKKQKVLPPISEDEKPFEIPNGWEWVKLGNVLKKITDGTHHSPTNVSEGDFLYISAKNIKDKGVLLSNATYVTKEAHEEIYSRCDPEYGDILYIKDGATTGIATINDLVEPFSMLSSVALLKCPNYILNRYLLLSLRSPYFYEEMRAGMTGVAITRVTLKKLNEAFICLPPLEEQKSIVTKIEELLILCDQVKENINISKNTRLHLADAMAEQAIK